MGYLGLAPQFGDLQKQVLTPDSIETDFTLDYAVPYPQALLINYGGVVQEPGIAYTTSGTTVSFTFTPTTGILLYVVFLGRILEVNVPAANSVGELQLALSAGTAGQVITSDGAGGIAFATPGWQFIASVTASADTSVAFTSIGTAYRTLMIEIGEVVVTTDDTELLMTFDYGAGEIITGYEGLFEGHASNGTAIANVMLTTAVELIGFTGAGNGIGTTTEGVKGGLVYILDANNSGTYTAAKSFCHWENSGTQYSSANAFSVQETDGAVDGITIKPGGGNITGTFKLYGLR